MSEENEPRKRLMKIIISHIEDCINNKIDQDSFIQICLDVIVASRGLRDYVNKLLIASDAQKNFPCTSGAYFLNTKTIVIVPKNIETDIKDDKNTYEMEYTDREEAYINLLAFIKVMYHEIEHANQYKIMQTTNSWQSEIIQIELSATNCIDPSPYLKNKDYTSMRSHYKDTYFCSAIERMADIEAYKFIIEMLEPLKNELPNVYDFYLAKLCNEYTVAYYPFNDNPKLRVPFLECIKDYVDEDYIERIPWNDEDSVKRFKKCSALYDKETRFLFGLPICPEEFYEKANLYIALRNKHREKNQKNSKILR